jgi:hypothetical protein
MKLRISSIRIDGGAQPRARVSLETVSEYAAEIKAGAKFPHITVFYDGTDYWLADGFHRRDAFIASGATSIEAEVKQGTQRDAILFSAGANATHGMRRTNDDKRRAVLKLLEDAKWSKWSDREIARRCAVSRELVGDLRTDLTVTSDSEIPTEKTYTTRHGTTATMRTENIGRSEPTIVKEEKREPQEVKPIESDLDTRRKAAREAVEWFLNSLDSVSRRREIEHLQEWLSDLSKEE